MITRENIIHFYTKYKENLKTEDQIQENLLKAEDQEAWIENLKNKSRMMRRLYIENEALLNLYIRPFLDGEASLNEELAREFLHQIRMADEEGYEDNLAMLEILELLDGYFQKSDDLDSYIWTLNLLGNFYNRPFSDEDGKKAIEKLNMLGVATHPEPERYYPAHTLASQIIGFMSYEGKFLVGLFKRK